ncbi:MAG: hypothetical protein IT430_17470 [Phycisphaerales bacterium]|nr:hypothetical protein [Phycisphaerales bacterium]
MNQTSAAIAADDTASRTGDEVQCPRCGYDLRGAVQSWREACPLEGRCTECGLEFRWGWVLREQVHEWLFEHQWRRQWVRSLLRTMVACPRGSRIAREATIMHVIRLRPLLLLAIILWLIVVALRAGTLAYAVHAFFRAPWSWRSGGSRLNAGLRWLLRDEFDFFAIYLAAVVLLPPLAFFFIPASLQRIKVRYIHLARLGCYWMIGAATMVLLLSMVQAIWHAFGADAPLLLRPGAWRFPANTAYSDANIVVFAQTVLPLWLLAIGWAWVWWRAACRDYLRLPDATLTATLLMVIVALASYLVQHAVIVMQSLL